LHFHGQGIGLAAFLVDVERAKTYPNPKLAGVELKPGMTATVDIRTGLAQYSSIWRNRFTGRLAGR
jgi:hypothetical protein